MENKELKNQNEEKEYKYLKSEDKKANRAVFENEGLEITLKPRLSYKGKKLIQGESYKGLKRVTKPGKDITKVGSIETDTGETILSALAHDEKLLQASVAKWNRQEQFKAGDFLDMLDQDEFIEEILEYLADSNGLNEKSKKEVEEAKND